MAVKLHTILILMAALLWSAVVPAAADRLLLERMISRVNYYRDQHDLQPLRINLTLMEVAQAHSEAMLSDSCFAHRCPKRPGLVARLKEAGYPYRVASENIAAGFERPERVVDVWMRSASHRENMLDPRVAEAGVGYAFIDRDRDHLEYGHYWTLNLGAQLGR